MGELIGTVKRIFHNEKVNWKVAGLRTQQDELFKQVEKGKPYSEIEPDNFRLQEKIENLEQTKK